MLNVVRCERVWYASERKTHTQQRAAEGEQNAFRQNLAHQPASACA